MKAKKKKKAKKRKKKISTSKFAIKKGGTNSTGTKKK
jgi:hypothetical protein